jgi:hypothetical protein
MRAASDQASRQMLELCQLYLQFTLEGACTLREDIENEASTIKNAAFDQSFQVAFLRSSQGMVEQDQIGIMLLDELSYLTRLATTYKILGVCTLTTGCGDSKNPGSRRNNQLFEFRQVFAMSFIEYIHVYQYGSITALDAFDI